MKSIKIRAIFILATTITTPLSFVEQQKTWHIFLFCFCLSVYVFFVLFFSPIFTVRDRKSFAWQNNEYKSFCVTNCMLCSTVWKTYSLNGITFTASITVRWFSRERKIGRKWKKRTGQKVTILARHDTRRYSQYGHLMESRDYFSFYLVFFLLLLLFWSIAVDLISVVCW